jgi:hypothetical protein
MSTRTDESRPARRPPCPGTRAWSCSGIHAGAFCGVQAGQPFLTAPSPASSAARRCRWSRIPCTMCELLHTSGRRSNAFWNLMNRAPTGLGGATQENFDERASCHSRSRLFAAPAWPSRFRMAARIGAPAVCHEPAGAHACPRVGEIMRGRGCVGKPSCGRPFAGLKGGSGW